MPESALLVTDCRQNHLDQAGSQARAPLDRVAIHQFPMEKILATRAEIATAEERPGQLSA